MDFHSWLFPFGKPVFIMTVTSLSKDGNNCNMQRFYNPPCSCGGAAVGPAVLLRGRAAPSPPAPHVLGAAEMNGVFVSWVASVP